MIKFVFSVYLFSGLAYAFSSGSENENQINPSDFTYAIFKDARPVCVGVEIKTCPDAKFIVTAAHCVYGVQNSRLTASLGNSIFDYKKVEHVNQIIVHPYYMPPSVDYDIAILKIKLQTSKNSGLWLNFEGRPLTKLTPIKSQPSSGNPVSLVNWDLKAENNNLTLSSGTAEDRKSCRMKLADYINVSSKMLCANFQSGAVPDGSPFLFQDGFVGIFSYRVQGDKENLPKIFTNVAHPEIYFFIEKYI